MDISQKCNSIGIPTNGISNGFPILEDVIITQDEEGNLVALEKPERPLKSWERPNPAKAFPAETLAKIQAIVNDDLKSLPQADQDAIMAAQEEEAQTSDFDEIFWKIARAFLMAFMGRYYSTRPQWLVDTGWIDLVDKLCPDGVLFDWKDRVQSTEVKGMEIKKL